MSANLMPELRSILTGEKPYQRAPICVKYFASVKPGIRYGTTSASGSRASTCRLMMSNTGDSTGSVTTGGADFMISSSAQGDAIAAYIQQHAAEYNVKYVIWSQRYWTPGSSWSLMADRGSVTANHYDHVHVTVN